MSGSTAGIFLVTINIGRAVMAKKDKDLFETLRARGLRTKVARAVTDGGNSGEKAARKALNDLQSAADDIRSRVTGGSSSSSRSEAALKAARTRKRKAAARSASSKKAAATRAKAKAKPKTKR
ncbi:MAG: hypothetical protein WKF96_05460 [Solirubrobacteraceae bacterium]